MKEEIIRHFLIDGKMDDSFEIHENYLVNMQIICICKFYRGNKREVLL